MNPSNTNLQSRLTKLASLKLLEKNQRYQVRFWSNAILHNEFKVACEKRGISMQEAFNEFMLWYTEESIQVEDGYGKKV